MAFGMTRGDDSPIIMELSTRAGMERSLFYWLLPHLGGLPIKQKIACPTQLRFSRTRESKSILTSIFSVFSSRVLACTACVTLFLGCGGNFKERVYNAPKVDTEFVKGPPTGQASPTASTSFPPMMGASKIPLEDRRILGAVIPYATQAFYIKATDRIDRLEAVASEFRTVVERFSVDPKTGSLELSLPEKWSMKKRENDIAMAELNVVTASGNVQFTITSLSKPEDLSQWDDYLLSNINRWRGQLQLPPTDVSSLQKDLPTVPRDGAPLPAYIFDANGGSAKTSAIPPSNLNSNQPADPSPVAKPPATEPTQKLSYDKPDSWELQPPRAFREATFKIVRDQREGEVTISTKTRDAPIPNAAMWYGQLLKKDEPELQTQLATKTVDEAEDIQAGSRTAKLYTVRASDDADSKALLVAAIPTGEPGMCWFVKLNCDLRMIEEEKSVFLGFVNSLSWE